MKEYDISKQSKVSVSITVEADSPDEALGKINKQFINELFDQKLEEIRVATRKRVDEVNKTLKPGEHIKIKSIDYVGEGKIEMIKIKD